jgi:membrane-associated protease RseP (regulator of RpoE activity)
MVAAVLATALLASAATYVAMRASDANRASDPAAATVPAPAASSSARSSSGSTAPRPSTAPGAPAGGQRRSRPWLGIRVVTLDPAIAQANGLPVDNGAWITASTAQANQGLNGGSSASQDPNAESSPGTDSDGEGSQGADPNAGSSPGTDTDGEGQGPAGQAPRNGVAQTGDAVIPGSPADQAGLRAGDIITAVDGTTLDATHRLDQVLGGYAAGDTVHMDVLRDGRHVTVSVTLGTRPANP